MAKREILAGATDQTIDIFVNDSSVSTGGGLTGLVFNTSGLTCYYRKGATGTPTALTLATQTVGGAHSDGGFVAVDGTNCPGQYRLDLSDTIVATAGMVTLYLRGAANMVPCVIEIEVVNFSHTGQSAIDLKDFADDGYDPSTNKVVGVVLVDTATALTNGVNTTSIAGSATAADNLKAASGGGGAYNLTVDAVAISGDSTAADNAEAFFDGTGYAGTNNVIPTVTTLTNLPAITSGWLTAAGIAADAITAAKLAPDVTTELQSGLATAVVLNQLSAAVIIEAGQSTSGGSTTTLIDTGRPETTTDYWKGSVLLLTSGNQCFQSRLITGWNGSTFTFTVDPPFTGVVATDTTYYILSGAGANVTQIAGDSTAATNAKNFWSTLLNGTAQAGAATTITLAAGSSASNSFYVGAVVRIVSGTGAGQERYITAYVGTTKVATVDAAWVTNPDSTSVYQILGRIV